MNLLATNQTLTMSSRDMKKYEFTGKEMHVFGRTLKQIVCVTAFASVSVGDIGGWIGSEKNLSHDGNAWVYGDARVYGNARC